MNTVSLCMIVKNEEQTLGRCLETIAAYVDEIVVLDTGSVDGTKDIARKYTDRVFDFPWQDDFALARNASFEKASMDYILWMDADDILLPPDQEKFKKLKVSLDPSVNAVTMIYRLAEDPWGNVVMSLRRHRLVKRSAGFRWQGAVHEYLGIWGRVLHSDVTVTHRPAGDRSMRNLRIYERRWRTGQPFAPRDLFYYANEWYEQGNYEKASQMYEKFLEGGRGWVEDCFVAHNRLADCYRALNRPEKQWEALSGALRYGPPRAETSCRLGYYFLDRGHLPAAVFWYETAARSVPQRETVGWVDHACWTWLPHIQLCVCYDRLGEYERAYRHNELARQWRPTDPQVLHNKEYLEKVRGVRKVEQGHPPGVEECLPADVDPGYRPTAGCQRPVTGTKDSGE